MSWIDTWKEDFRQTYTAGVRAGGSGVCQEDIDIAFGVWWKNKHELFPIEELNLNVRAYNCFKRNGINTIGEVRTWLSVDCDDPEGNCDHYGGHPRVYDIKNFGWKTWETCVEALRRWDEVNG